VRSFHAPGSATVRHLWLAREDTALNGLNPTLVDGLWPWRSHLNDAAAVVSTLGHDDAVRAATEFARDLARHERTVVLAAAGAGEPLYCEVPEDRRLDCVRPDLLLLLVHNAFTASSRLLVTTAQQVVLITGLGTGEHDAARQLIDMLLDKASPGHIEIVIVADNRTAATDAGAELLLAASPRFGNRTSWRYLPAQRIHTADPDLEEGLMAISTPTATMTETPTKQWEDSFRRAEQLLAEAQQKLDHQLERSTMAMRATPPSERPQATA
jgi:hypothetical protein